MSFLQLLSQYASPQALLAASIVGPFVAPAFNEIKPLIDQIDPTKPVHDLVSKVAVLAIDFVGVVLVMWLTKAQASARDVVWAGIATFVAYLVGQAVYVAGRGPVPVTPTTTYLASVVQRHGDALTQVMANPPTTLKDVGDIEVPTA